MNLKRLLAVFILIVLLIGGVWSLGQPGGPAPESLARLQALSSATTGGERTTNGLGGEGNEVQEVIIHEPVQGSAIALSELPPEEDNGDSLYQQWLNGEIDLDEEESFLTPEQEAELRKTLEDKGPNDQIQVPNNALDNILLEKSFPGPDIRKCCSTTNQGTVPPDPELAVGTDHVIAVINIAFEIYNKDGIVQQTNTTFSSLFSGISGCNTLSQLFDPNVLYDESSDRFFLGIASVSGNYCAAVSATGNPTGTWYRYKFSTSSSGGFFDYPHAGIGRDAIYMGGNIFNCPGCSYREARVWAFNKTAMYANGAAGVVERLVPGGQTRDTPQPANLHGFAQGTWPTSGPHYFIIGENFNGSTYGVFAWTNPFGSNNFGSTGTFNLTTATGVSPVLPFTTAQQLGSAKRLRTNDWRVQDNEYRNGYLWTTNTISCNPGGGVVTCVRWAQVNPTNATIVQAGVVGSPNEYRMFADLAVNHCSDMAMGYTKTSASSYPGIWVAGREVSDPINTLQGEGIMKAGETSYDGSDQPPLRWGDYTGLTSDPNGRDLWYIGQFSKNVSHPAANWGTHIGCYTVPSCQVPNSVAQTGAGGTAEFPPEGLDLFSYLPMIAYDPIPPAIPCSPSP